MPYRRTVRRSSGRKRKPKTFEEVSAMTGTDFYQCSNGITFYWINPDMENQITVGDLVAKFYRINDGQNPLVLTCINAPYSPLPEKTWYAVMRGNFFIEIIEGRNKEGPHQTKLWFKSFTTKQTFWIATLQTMAFFYNENEIKEAILKAVGEKEFYIYPPNKDRGLVP